MGMDDTLGGPCGTGCKENQRLVIQLSLAAKVTHAASNTVIESIPSRGIDDGQIRLGNSAQQRRAGGRIHQHQPRLDGARQVFDLEDREPAIDRHQTGAAMPHGENVEEKFQLITVVNEDPLAAAQAFILEISDASVDSPNNLTAAPGPPANRIDKAARLCFKKHLRLRTIKYSAYL